MENYFNWFVFIHTFLGKSKTETKQSTERQSYCQRKSLFWFFVREVNWLFKGCPLTGPVPVSAPVIIYFFPSENTCIVGNEKIRTRAGLLRFARMARRIFLRTVIDWANSFFLLFSMLTFFCFKINSCLSNINNERKRKRELKKDSKHESNSLFFRDASPCSVCSSYLSLKQAHESKA